MRCHGPTWKYVDAALQMCSRGFWFGDRIGINLFPDSFHSQANPNISSPDVLLSVFTPYHHLKKPIALRSVKISNMSAEHLWSSDERSQMKMSSPHSWWIQPQQLQAPPPHHDSRFWVQTLFLPSTHKYQPCLYSLYVAGVKACAILLVKCILIQLIHPSNSHLYSVSMGNIN